MAGDWIKIEHALPNKPEVMRLAEILSISELEVVGHLVLFWTWVDQNLSEECPVVNGTSSGLDRVAGRKGFTQSLIDVGWLILEDGMVEIPNYDDHLSKSAKARALEAKRKRLSRKKCLDDNRTNGGTQSGQNTGLEKRREENTKKEKVKRKKASNPETYPDEFESFWEACPRKVGKGNAWKAWKPASLSAAASKNKSPTETVAEFLTRRMRDYAAFMADKDAQFIRHPATWLNGGNWDDEVGSRVATAETKQNWRP